MLCPKEGTKSGDDATAEDGEHIFSALATKKLEAAIRKKAVQFYRSEEVQSIQSALEQKISRGVLTVRSDKHVGRDVGLKRTLFDIMFAYVVRPHFLFLHSHVQHAHSQLFFS